MAKFIPETLHNLPNSARRHVSKALKTLPEYFTVRVPVITEKWPVDLVVEGPDNTWLNLIFVDDMQAFKVRKEALAKHFESTNHDCIQSTERPLNAQFLMIVWNGKSEQAHQMETGSSRFRLVGRGYFLDNTEALITDNCSQTSHEVFEWLHHTVLPEREVPPACTTRTLLERDNRAQLSNFFLDYDQELAAKLDLFLPESDENTGHAVRLINGVAGSGKTLIIVSRILMYCAKYPEHKILLLIHNKPVTADIKHRIKKHWGGIPDNLEIKTFWSWCRAQWVEAFRKKQIKIHFKANNVTNYIAEERGKYQVERLTDGQLYDEIEFINNHMMFDEPSYLEASRAGRGFALRGDERSKIWGLLEATNKQFGSASGLLPSLIPKQLSDTRLYDASDIKTYEHVIVDEAQFFAPSWFEVVKRSLKDSGSLFMCADPNQGFLKSRLSWKSAGISVRGRTKVLRKSYRTTQQILHAANRFLTDMCPDSGEDYIQPEYENMTQGEQPVLFYKDSPQDCIDQLVNETKAMIEQGIPANQIMVLYTTGSSPSGLQKCLEPVVGKENIWNFSSRGADQAPDEEKAGFLKIAKMDAATGLEAGVVFIMGVEQVFSSYESLDLTDEERGDKQQEAARKMYMAMTRAGQRLVMFSTSRVSEVLEDAVEVNGTAIV